MLHILRKMGYTYFEKAVGKMRIWKVFAWIFQLHFSNFISNFPTYRFFHLLFPTTQILAKRLNKTPSVSGSGPEIENFQRTVKIFRLDDETVKRIWHLRFELKWLILFLSTVLGLSLCLDGVCLGVCTERHDPIGGILFHKNQKIHQTVLK